MSSKNSEVKRSYKYCIVPECRNSSASTPENKFLTIPKDSEVRKKWMVAMRRKKFISPNSTKFCCEDHFELELDMINYDQWKSKRGSGRIILKKCVVPHKFQCQPSRQILVTRPRATSISRMCSTVDVALHLDTQHCVSSSLCSNEVKDISGTICTVTSFDIEDHMQSLDKVSLLEVDRCDVGIQVNLTSLPPLVKLQRKFTDAQETDGSELDTSFTSSSSEDESDFHSVIAESSSECSNAYESIENDDKEFVELKKKRLETTIPLMMKFPKRYMGVADHAIFFIDILQKRLVTTKGKFSKCNVTNVIMLVLRKIRLNESFGILGIDFGISGSRAAVLFSHFVYPISSMMKQLIVWPSAETIKNNLPLLFRANYNTVQSIIDCFEISIEKPSDPVKQALTWSDYKSTNTMKYFISITPNGVVNFISGGFGGRISDLLITEKCGFLSVLPSGAAVMADRGFKNINGLLLQKDCVLIRPPSVESATRSSSEDVTKTRKVAALRIHVERGIRRIREYLLLSPHSDIDCNLLRMLDECVIIACALVNLQEPLIR